jgi:hypothetical protein
MRRVGGDYIICRISQVTGGVSKSELERLDRHSGALPRRQIRLVNGEGEPVVVKVWEDPLKDGGRWRLVRGTVKGWVVEVEYRIQPGEGLIEILPLVTSVSLRSVDPDLAECLKALDLR